MRQEDEEFTAQWAVAFEAAFTTALAELEAGDADADEILDVEDGLVEDAR